MNTSNNYLLTLSIGPVQDFIASARRTRDFCYASELLSTVCRAVAKYLSEKENIRLIFPTNPNSKGIANVILCAVTGSNNIENMRTLSSEAEEIAKEKWNAIASDVLRQCQHAINQDIWNSQVDDVIECYSAWLPFTEETYQDSRKELMLLLAGRKALRNFHPAKGFPGVQKSSLDGARESVLTENRGDLLRRFRIREKKENIEHLDVIGLVKRCGGGNKSFPSVSRVAVDPWLRGISKKVQENPAIAQAWGGILMDLNQLENENLLPHIGNEYPQYNPPRSDFPFEGTLLYQSRFKDFQEEGVFTNAFRENYSKKLRNLIKNSGLGEPSPYLAVLVADGDRMGSVISNQTSIEAHQELSSQLDQFTQSAKEIIQKYNGFTVYAGGDDVLAFVPVDHCLQASHDLYHSFVDTLNKYRDNEQKSPTLSVGIAICHFMDPFEDILAWGRQAEKSAKNPDRAGLAIHLHTRGGAPIMIRSQWKSGIVTRLEYAVQLLLMDQIPDKAAYELRNLASQYAGHWDGIEDALLKDVIRVLERKKKLNDDNRKKLEKELSNLIETTPDRNCAKAVEIFASELLIARHLTASVKQACSTDFIIPRFQGGNND